MLEMFKRRAPAKEADASRDGQNDA
jgi:hypothetical protein